MADTSCSDSDFDRFGGLKNGKDVQKECLAAGSTALLNDSPVEAAEIFKTVLDKMSCKSNQKLPMGQLVLRYALCIAWIKCNDYIHIADAIGSLLELIDSGYASKLPALYLAVAKAYFALNRFKKALEYVEKGLKTVQSNSKIKQQSWPGLKNTIDETGKDFLQKELLALQKDCNNSQPPDALCGFNKCLENSNHILPSQEIFLKDPDFCPFLYLKCDADCKFAYHGACWECLKHENLNLKEPKDLLNTPCPTDKCKSNSGSCSFITEVSLIGKEGFDKPSDEWHHPHYSSRNNDNKHSMPKFRNQTDHGSSFDKFDSSGESSNRPTDKCCLSGQLKESSSASQPSSSTIVHTIESTVIPEEKSKEKSLKWKSPMPVQLSGSPKLVPVVSTKQAHSLHQVSLHGPKPSLVPSSKDQPIFSLNRHPYYHSGAFPPFILPQIFGAPMYYPLQTQQPLGLRPGPPPIVFHPGPPSLVLQQVPRPVALQQALPPLTPAQLATSRQVSSRPPMSNQPCVEVMVNNSSYLPAGSKLLVPVGADGGAVQIIHSEQNPQEGNCNLNYASSPELCQVSQTVQVEQAPVKSVVEEFKSVVKKLSGEPCKATSSKCKPQPCSDSSDSVRRVSMKTVVEEFKKLVHDLAGENDSGDTPKKSSEIEVSLNEGFQEEHSFQSSASLPPLSSSATSVSTSSMCTSPPSVLFKPSSDVLMTTTSTSLQAKSKSSPLKDIPNHMDHQPVIHYSSLESSLCSSQDDVSLEPLDSSRFATLLDILSQCRAMKFGYLDNENVNPELQCFGHPYENNSTMQNIKIPDDIDKVDENQAQFVFSYYHSVFSNDGPYKIDTLQDTWQKTSADLGLPETFTNKYPRLSEFLLKSERFAAIDDFIGTSDLLPNMFSKAEEELRESISFLLKHFGNNSFKNLYSNQSHNNNVISNSHSHMGSSLSSGTDVDDLGSDSLKEDSTGYFTAAEMDLMKSRDKNANPIPRNSFTSSLDSSPPVNGCINPTSKPFVSKSSELTNSAKAEGVYMSDDDEEIEVSLTDTDQSLNQVENDHMPYSEFVSDTFKGSSLVPSKWSEGNNLVSKKMSQHMQTDSYIDEENGKLLRDKELLQKEASELKCENSKLQSLVLTLQSQLHSTVKIQESQHTNALKQMQEKLDDLERKNSDELKEIQSKISFKELELSQLKEHLKEKDNEVMERDTLLNKLRRSHVNTEKLIEEKRQREEELQNLLKLKDQRLIQLWKDYCEFKIKKFNHLCNDRINVLSQLKDIMSDTVPPTKSDLKSMIKTYEDLMISVTKKNTEVNEIFTREVERVRNGLQCVLPGVIDVPDIMSMHYPPNGAFEHLIRTKQEEYGLPRNHFSSAYSRFYQPLGSNSTQTVPQTRESEGYSLLSNSSLFSQGRNETSQLWGSSFSSTSNNLSGLPFEGFSSSNSNLMSVQPSLNLMPNMMPFQNSNPQSSSVQSIIGQNRGSPSPSLPFSGSGSLFGSNSSLASAVGTKAPPATSTIQKPVSSVAPPLPVLKSTAQVVSVNTPVTAIAQGAIPKPRVQTATSSMTPIVPSKPLVRPVLKQMKTNESNFEKLMRNLQKMFPTRNDQDLTQALKMVREKNGGTLSSLTYSEIVAKVEEVLNKHFRKPATMGWEKFGKAAWGTAKPNVVEWEGSVEEDECGICMDPLHTKEVYTLECKHKFHKECIRKWLVTNGVCPNCRMHSTMLEDFPPLG